MNEDYVKYPPWCPLRLRAEGNRQQMSTLNCKDGFIYTVVSGDTMYRISKKYNVSLDALIRANPQIADPAVIYPGMQICVPTTSPTPPLPKPPNCTGGYLYTIKRGDTLTKIALRFDLTIQDILRANPQIKDQNILYVGQQICIPLPIPPVTSCVQGEIYVVKKGENLTSIAAKLNLTVEELLNANPQILNPELIFSGQELCIPM